MNIIGGNYSLFTALCSLLSALFLPQLNLIEFIDPLFPAPAPAPARRSTLDPPRLSAPRLFAVVSKTPLQKG
jgi:hypothetical protein